MRTHARKFSSGAAGGRRTRVGIRAAGAAGGRRTRVGIRAAGAVAALLLAALPATAAAATVPPTLTSAFTPASIGLGGTTALSFTITNPNTSTLTGIGFTDTLPAGLVVDNPNGLTGTCGASSTLTAPAGGSTITLTGGSLAGNNATCTLQISVTSNTAGSYHNGTGQVSSTEGGAGAGDTQALTVFGLPTVSVASPAENAVFNFGQQVTAKYTCTDAPGAPGIAACSGDVDSGTPIDTSTVGPGTFSVSAISADGAITTQTIDYVVLPDNRITVSKATGHAGGTVTFNVKVPGAGKLTATLTRHGKTVGQLATRLRSDGTSTLTIRPNGAGRQLLKADRKQKHPTPISLKLAVTFVPTGGRAGKPAVAIVSVRP